MDTIRILQTLRLKGRVAATDLAAAAGVNDAHCTTLVDQLTTAGHVEEARARLKLTATGRERLTHLLAQERGTVDQELLSGLYDEFEAHNTALKSLMTRWQLKTGDVPNDHTDTVYDHAIVADLAVVDQHFKPLLARMIDVVPRLGHYPNRLSGALARVEAGDHSWFAKPLADSYHTVWFELHEDLIGLAGLSRVEEAAAGRAE